MPTYEYACKDCGNHFDIVQSFSDDALTVCPSCEGSLRKVFSAAGIIFKGSGWHIKDYAKTGGSSGSTSSGEESSGEGGSSDRDTKTAGADSTSTNGSESTASKSSDKPSKSGTSTSDTASSKPSSTTSDTAKSA